MSKCLAASRKAGSIHPKEARMHSSQVKRRIFGSRQGSLSRHLCSARYGTPKNGCLWARAVLWPSHQIYGLPVRRAMIYPVRFARVFLWMIFLSLRPFLLCCRFFGNVAVLYILYENKKLAHVINMLRCHHFCPESKLFWVFYLTFRCSFIVRCARSGQGSM